MKKASIIFLFAAVAFGVTLFFVGGGERFQSGRERIIELRDDGFHPSNITVRKGDTITFITSRSSYFWPASNLHPTHGIYPEFDSKKPTGPRERWSFRFTKVGTWKYHDHLSPYFIGEVEVLKQGECLPFLDTGKQTYDTRGDKPAPFQIVEVDIDPVDVEYEQWQTITVRVRDEGNNTITKESGVVTNIATDSKKTTVALKLIRGDDQTSSFQDAGVQQVLITQWRGSWIREDTNCHTYKATITATNSKGDKTSTEVLFK